MDPQNLKYTREHEWVGLESPEVALIGITDYAQDQLGDVVYLALPEPGGRIVQLQKFGEVESVKSVSDLFSPVNGEVLAVNQALRDHPELVNQDPLGEGWLLRVRLANPAELNTLMSKEEYERFLRREGG